MEESLNKILEELKSLNSRVGKVEEGQQRLQSEVKIGLEEVNKRLDLGLEEVNKRLDNISIQVALNTE